MPYRRLPNTDQARVRALRTAIAENERRVEKNDVMLPFGLVQDAKSFLNRFEKSLAQYKQALDAQVSANKSFQHETHAARIYISHFIQVLNLAVVREDIKKDRKVFYGLDPDDFTAPDLSSETAILKWGQNLINGEQRRIQEGGTPMYNPGIAKVRVHYDVFKERKESQKIYQQSTSRYLKLVADMRAEGDEIILSIWNEIEKRYASLPPYKRLLECQNYGLVYYYRRNEPQLTPESDVAYEAAAAAEQYISFEQE